MTKDKNRDKIRTMFDSIAPKYDLLNHVLSMGIDKGWRKKVVKIVSSVSPKKVLDVATGTGDLAIAIAKSSDGISITAVDLSPNMLECAKDKISKMKLSSDISLKVGDALNLSFEEGAFDVVTISFGVRNFEDLQKGLSELLRVLKSGGVLLVLEFSKPKGVLSKPYIFYLKNILPLIGRCISKNRYAYTYLPDSVMEFPCGEHFLSILKDVGFGEVSHKPLSMGIATIYTAKKL